MPIDAKDVDKFVQAEGEWVEHAIGLRCPCHNDHGQPDPNCELHELGGWFFPSTEKIIGLVTAISSHKDWLESGVALPSDCVFSPLTGDTVSEGDKITFTWPSPIGQGEALVRGYEATDGLYYVATETIVCIDIDKVFYKQGVDYRLEGRTIVWSWEGKTGKAPGPGTKYSIKYRGYIEWIAMEPPATRVSHGADIGSRVLLRKKHIYEQ